MAAQQPLTADYLRFHARHAPKAIALIDNGRAFSYGRFDRDLRKFTAALRRFGLPRGSVVAIACGDLYVQWQLLLACESLGLATVSVLRTETGSLIPLLPRIQLLLTTHDMPGTEKVKSHRITAKWVSGVLAMSEGEAGSPANDQPLEPSDVQFLRRTSGTTGERKTMSVNRGLVEARMQSNYPVLGITPRSRFLISAHFTVHYIYTYATMCLRVGGLCVGAGDDLARAVARQRPTHLRLFQFQARPLLDNLPKDFRKPADLTVILGSASLSDALRKEIAERLATRLVYQYGTNETGTMAAIGEDGLATPYAGVETKVVNARGLPVAPGHEGRLMVRTPLMVDGYLGEPELTARTFRDGWFVTGDVATLLPSGQLRLAGRSDEMLNIGGLKIAPAQLEEIAAQTVPVEDVAVTSFPNADGIEELCVALVLSDKARLKESGGRISRNLPTSLGKMHFVAVDRIPRTMDTGKIRRGELKRSLAVK